MDPEPLGSLQMAPAGVCLVKDGVEEAVATGLGSAQAMPEAMGHQV